MMACLLAGIVPAPPHIQTHTHTSPLAPPPPSDTYKNYPAPPVPPVPRPAPSSSSSSCSSNAASASTRDIHSDHLREAVRDASPPARQRAYVMRSARRKRSGRLGQSRRRAGRAGRGWRTMHTGDVRALPGPLRPLVLGGPVPLRYETSGPGNKCPQPRVVM